MKEVEKKINKALLELISKSLFGADLSIELNRDELAELFEESNLQTVIGIVFDVLPLGYEKVNPQVYGMWQAMAFGLLSSANAISYANAQLTELLRKADIKHCTIKGSASAFYYPKPYLRQMGDIDFLINPSDSPKAVKLLEENGFANLNVEHPFHIEFKKNKVDYEMHTQICLPPKGKEFVLDFAKDIIPNSVKKNINNSDFISPDTFAHGMIILLHMLRHIEVCEGIGLRHLCDWAVFVNSLSDSEFCDIFESYLKSSGLWRFAQIMSQLCYVYFKMPYKKWLGKIDKQLAEDMMEDILQSGNFGKKDSTRNQSSVFVDSTFSDDAYSQIFMKSITKKVYKWCPFFKKHKLLMPIGYIGYFFRISFKMIIGSKTVNFRSIMENGVKRNEIYKKLNIFIEEK